LLKVTHAKNEIKWKKRRKIPDHQFIVSCNSDKSFFTNNGAKCVGMDRSYGMDDKWSGNSFLLGSSSLVNHGS